MIYFNFISKELFSKVPSFEEFSASSVFEVEGSGNRFDDFISPEFKGNFLDNLVDEGIGFAFLVFFSNDITGSLCFKSWEIFKFVDDGLSEGISSIGSEIKFTLGSSSS